MKGPDHKASLEIDEFAIMVENIRNIPSGSGPWILETWEKDGEIVFRKNKEYWGKPAKMSRLKLRILPTILTQSAEFTVGNIDLFDIPALELLEWKQDEDWTENIFSLEELNIWYIAMNCSRPPFNDIRVRKAMNLALDREKILHLLLAGMGTLSSGPVPPGLLSAPAPPPYPYNPKRALELFELLVSIISFFHSINFFLKYVLCFSHIYFSFSLGVYFFTIASNYNIV